MYDTSDFEQIVRRIAAEAVGQRIFKGTFICTGKPKGHLAKGMMVPHAIESGWFPLAALHVGDGYGILIGPEVGDPMLAKPEGRLLKWVEPPSNSFSGCVWLEPQGTQTWYLGSLDADPDRQNSGLGKTLLNAAEQWVRQRGGTRVRITVVNVRDALVAWYQRRGYRLTGQIEPFPYGDDRFGTPLRDHLSFLVLEKQLAPVHDAG